MVTLSDSVAVVTGAASGIGESTAKRLAAAGAAVVVSDVDEAGSETVAEELRAEGGEATAITCDVADADAVDALVDRATGAYGTVDVLVNNAGVYDDGTSAGDASEALWDQVVDVNLKGPFLLTKAALPALQEGDDEGVVVNVASVAGKVAAGGAAYVSSKHGLVGLTKQLANDYGPEVRVNAVCPGFVETGMTADLIEETPDEVRQMVEATPAGRYAEPDEVGRVVRFLASDEASFMHGAAVDVDGGWLVD